jgi:hypothetical protein
MFIRKQLKLLQAQEAGLFHVVSRPLPLKYTVPVVVAEDQIPGVLPVVAVELEVMPRQHSPLLQVP